uniref:NADH-ubiquinone oxidoreductase chain 3 n=1 Tax=Pauropus longiramus TaxID=933850 RepID=G9BG45_9MYRI|nr:NADH dehydrogenase subunit 3 [Pauropus longiramus]ADT63083.1 NADH dehydrogenase subunit 3 [Pauropus longiramus]
MLFSLIFISLLILTIMLLSFLIPYNSFFNTSFFSSFECGLENLNLKTTFSLRFFILTLIFLLFDIEMVILIPLSLMSFVSPFMALLISLPFILSLNLTLKYEKDLQNLK